jgi:cellulose synthase/poly-beta-1,6-N-acetylglucosamine synthase-like glycosyltransferase
MSVAVLVWLASLAACVYVYVGYPALLVVLSRLHPRPVQKGLVRAPVSVIVAAFNEEAVIREKIRDTFSNGYPEHLIELIVASDGSTDRTEEIVRALDHPRVRLLSLPRGGKSAALNQAARHATGDLLVFTDADVRLAPGALSALLASLSDPTVGGVAGRKVPMPSQTGSVSHGEGLYVRFDEWQKRLESTFGSAVASHGALHAIRRGLFVPIRDVSAADDMAISMQVVLQGHRLVYEPEAIAYVEPPTAAGSEFRRKVRIATQVVRALFSLGSALWTSGFYSVQLVSHKLLRYVVPVFLILMVLSNVYLALITGSLFWKGLLVAQAAFYGLAAAGHVVHNRLRGLFRLLLIPYYFCLVNASAIAALVGLIRGSRPGMWAPRGGF